MSANNLFIVHGDTIEDITNILKQIYMRIISRLLFSACLFYRKWIFTSLHVILPDIACNLQTIINKYEQADWKLIILVLGVMWPHSKTQNNIIRIVYWKVITGSYIINQLLYEMTWLIEQNYTMIRIYVNLWHYMTSRYNAAGLLIMTYKITASETYHLLGSNH